MASGNENIYLFLLQEMRTNGGSNRQVKEILRTPEILQKPTFKPTTPVICSNTKESTEEDSLTLLKRINREEKALLNQKNELTQNSQKLQQKIAEQLEIRKHRIENSKTEISELKKECQILQTAIEKYYSN